MQRLALLLDATVKMDAAMAVVSGVDAPREIIADGETGLLVRPQDAEYLGGTVTSPIADRARPEAPCRAARAWGCPLAVGAARPAKSRRDRAMDARSPRTRLASVCARLRRSRLTRITRR